MGSRSLELFRTVYDAVEALTPEIYPIFPFRRWKSNTPLEQAEGKDLVRAFRVGLGPIVRPGNTNSNRETKYFAGQLMVTLGYPPQLQDGQDPDALGVEGMLSTDTTAIVNLLLYRRVATLVALPSSTRLLAPFSAQRLPKTLVLSFDLEWGETV